MKVLVVSQHYWPESFRINEVVLSLREAGCEVSVLTGQPNYPDGVVFEGYRGWQAGCEQHPAGYSVYRVPLVARGQGGALRLALNYLSFIASASALGPWLLRGQRFDAIFVYGTSPILQAIAAIVLKRIKRAALVVWVQDLWPESLEVTGFIHDRRTLDAVGQVVRWIYRRSDLLLAQSRRFVGSVQSMAGGTRVEYHPNPGELAFGQGSRDTGSPALVLEPGFNVLFAGNMGSVQALDTVLDAADLLRAHADIRIVLVGSGSRSEWLQHEIARRNLSNVQLAGRFEPHAMPLILSQASALLVSLSCGPILSQTIPAKIQAYLAAGQPILASLDGEGSRVVEEAGAGLTCPAEDAPALAQAILKLRSMSPAERQEMGTAGRRYFEGHFDPAVLADQLVAHLREAASFSRAGKNRPSAGSSSPR